MSNEFLIGYFCCPRNNIKTFSNRLDFLGEEYFSEMSLTVDFTPVSSMCLLPSIQQYQEVTINKYHSHCTFEHHSQEEI